MSALIRVIDLLSYYLFSRSNACVFFKDLRQWREIWNKKENCRYLNELPPVQPWFIRSLFMQRQTLKTNTDGTQLNFLFDARDNDEMLAYMSMNSFWGKTSNTSTIEIVAIDISNTHITNYLSSMILYIGTKLLMTNTLAL